MLQGMNRIRRSTFLVALLVASPCLAQLSAQPSHSFLFEAPDTAFVAADELFESAGIGCGGVGEVRDSGDAWAFDVRVGFEGALDPNPILVNKITGFATWASWDKWSREPR